METLARMLSLPSSPTPTISLHAEDLGDSLETVVLHQTVFWIIRFADVKQYGVNIIKPNIIFFFFFRISLLLFTLLASLVSNYNSFGMINLLVGEDSSFLVSPEESWSGRFLFFIIIILFRHRTEKILPVAGYVRTSRCCSFLQFFKIIFLFNIVVFSISCFITAFLLLLFPSLLSFHVCFISIINFPYFVYQCFWITVFKRTFQLLLRIFLVFLNVF